MRRPTPTQSSDPSGARAAHHSADEELRQQHLLLPLAEVAAPPQPPRPLLLRLPLRLSV